MSNDIFVADDKDELRQLVRFHLETAGHTVTTHPDGEACWHQLQRVDSPPDLLLADVIMPDVNGLQLLETIRQDDDLSELPVIMLTAHRTEADVVKRFDVDATDYLTKPFRSQKLLARVERYL